MALGSKTLSPFPIFMFGLILMVVVMMPLVHSSRTSLQGGKWVAEDTATATQALEKGALSSGLTAEDSAREVPTGPDPLHHNHQPTGP